MKAEFIARKSVFGDCGGRLFLCFLFCWLIVPIFIGIWLIMRASSYRLYFYPDKVVCTYGIIAKNEEQFRMTTIVGVSLQYSVWGRLFNYGNVLVDIVGKWGVNTMGIKRPRELKQYLESCIARQNAQNIQRFITN